MADVQLKVGINYAFLYKYYNPDNPSKQGFLLQGSGGCFYGDQKVVIEDGSKSISELRSAIRFCLIIPRPEKTSTKK